MRNKKTLSLAAIGATAALAGTGIVGAQAAATQTEDVRESDFLDAYSDTRSTGHYEFLEEGLHVWTEGSTSTDKVAEYFEIGGVKLSEVTDSTYDWYGTSNQPGQQFAIDKDGDAATTNDRGILVYEKVYGNDWWLTNGSAQSLKDAAPTTGGGSGSEYHGTPEAWAAKLPDATVLAGGFSLGSGVKGDGVLKSLTYGDTEYVFTSEQAPTTGQAPVERDVTGSSTKTVDGRKVFLTLKSNPAPADSTEGDKLRWSVIVDGFRGFRTAQGFGDTDEWSTRFAPDSGKHRVVVLKNGKQVRDFVVNTNR